MYDETIDLKPAFEHANVLDVADSVVEVLRKSEWFQGHGPSSRVHLLSNLISNHDAHTLGYVYDLVSDVCKLAEDDNVRILL
jgi:hypothetical protein